MYKRILVPTDGSEITAKAVDTAVALARLSGASLSTLCVKEPFPYSAISEMQPVPPQEFFDAQERIAGDGEARGLTAPIREAARRRDGLYDVRTGDGPRSETDDQNEHYDTLRGQGIRHIVLLTHHGGPEQNPAARIGTQLGNVTFLERPFHPITLVSVVTVSLLLAAIT